MSKLKSHKDSKKDEPVVFVTVLKGQAATAMSYHLRGKLEPNILIYIEIIFSYWNCIHSNVYLYAGVLHTV